MRERKIIRVLIASSKGLDPGKVRELKQTVRNMFAFFGKVDITVMKSTDDETILNAAVGFLKKEVDPFDYVLYDGFESNCNLIQRLNEEGVPTLVWNYFIGTYSLATAKRRKNSKVEMYDISYKFFDLQ